VSFGHVVQCDEARVHMKRREREREREREKERESFRLKSVRNREPVVREDCQNESQKTLSDEPLWHAHQTCDCE